MCTSHSRPGRDALPSLGRQTWQGLADMPCLGQVTPCQGWVGPPSQDQVDVWRQGLVALPQGQKDTLDHDLVDMLHRDLVAMCCPWPEDQEATFSI